MLTLELLVIGPKPLLCAAEGTHMAPGLLSLLKLTLDVIGILGVQAITTCETT
jgi:hypothetical protein